jgi:hypothetical protein
VRQMKFISTSQQPQQHSLSFKAHFFLQNKQKQSF